MKIRMPLKALLTATVFVSSSLTGPAGAQILPDPALEARAQEIHRQVITLDTHVDIPLDFATFKTDPGRLNSSQVDLPKMRAGDLDAAFFIVYTPQGELTANGYARAGFIARTRLEAILRMVRAYPEQTKLVRKADDVRRIVRSGRRAVLIGMENAYPLGPVFDIELWYNSGVRYVGITHFGHNQFGDSSNPNPDFGDEDEKHGGLSDLGRELVSDLNRFGIMVDVSHAGKKTMMQATQLSAAPIIASHSGVRAIADNARNLDDEQLRAIRDNGGVAQIVALDAYVKPYTEEQTAFRDALRKRLKMETSEQRANASAELRILYERQLDKMWEIEPRASVSDFVDHIDHAVKIAGIDHVGIASDFDGGGGIVGWEDASETLNVTRELVDRGYSEEDIAKIWGGNLLRVMREVEKVSKGTK